MSTELSKYSALPIRTGSTEDDPDESTESRDFYMNYAQLSAFTVGAQNTTAVVGRGGGKSDGILAPTIHRDAAAMPRSSGVALGTTYIQLLLRTLPAMFNGLHRMGYIRDKDYWVNRFPDKKDNLLMPWMCPLEPHHSIFLRHENTVSVMRLVSQDRPGSANGLSVDWVKGDEVKFLNKQKLDSEVRPINRGNNERYGDCPWHHGETFTTDMPTTAQGKWVFDAEIESQKPRNQEAIALILSIQQEIYNERKLLATSKRNIERLKRIAHLEKCLQQLRSGVTHFIEASSFVNVHVLGLKYFREQKRTTSPHNFNSSILGKRGMGVENGFYPDFDPNVHLYDAVDNEYLDAHFGSRGFEDCRKDTDLDYKQPLVLTMDAGGSFNCAYVTQRHFQEVRYLKAFGLPHPNKLAHVIALFDEYYAYFYSKRVTFVYDQTFTGTNAKDDMTYADEIISELKKRGWIVKWHYLGRVLNHKTRYEAWGKAFTQSDTRFPRQRFNRENTRLSVEAMTQARMMEGPKGVEKDKRPEKDLQIDQHTTTHYTDAQDTAFHYHVFEGELGGELLKVVSG